MRPRRAGLGLCAVVIVMGLAWSAVESSAQGSVGAGPLTSTLTDTEPTAGVFGMGPVKLAPGITVSQIGTDSNVFHEAENPKEDFIASGKPDVSAFMQLRFLTVSAYGGAELTYFRTYESERSVGYAGRARVDLLLSRLFPFVGYGQTQSRERPNSEIDARADRLQTEKSGGLGFRLSDTSAVYASAVRSTTKYEKAFEEGIELGPALNHYTDDFSGGVRTALTPLTSVTLRAGYQRDIFTQDPTRNADSRYLTGDFTFAPQASFTGIATLGFQDSKHVDPTVKPFRGITGSAALTYPVLEIGRLNFTAARSTEYSFDAADAYYVSTAFGLTYNQRLRGAVDAQVQGGRTLSDYGRREGSVPKRDTVETVSGGLGYNLRNRTRVGLSYEYARRRSEVAAQNYQGRRIFLSWMYAF